MSEPQFKVVTRCLADIKTERISWLWPQRIPRGKLTLFAGEPGIGKSMCALGVAATLSRGIEWPDGTRPCKPGRIGILAAEDDPADTIRPRLEAMGANLELIEIIDGGAYEDRPKDVHGLALNRDGIEAIRSLDLDLLIVDTLSHFIGGDLNSHGEVKRSMRPMIQWAMETGAAILGIEHLGKDNNKSPLQRVMGSTAIAGQARATWGFARDREDQSRFLMVSLKNNLAADIGGLAGRLVSDEGDDHPRIVWEPEPMLQTAEECFARNTKELSPAVRDACDFLKDELQHGHAYACDIYERGKSAGYSKKSLRAALKALGGEHVKENFQGKWLWRLPKDALHTDTGCSLEPFEDCPKERQRISIISSNNNSLGGNGTWQGS